jgi:hypothetical protein
MSRYVGAAPTGCASAASNDGGNLVPDEFAHAAPPTGNHDYTGTGVYEPDSSLQRGTDSRMPQRGDRRYR